MKGKNSRAVLSKKQSPHKAAGLSPGGQKIRHLQRLLDVVTRGKQMWQGTFDAISEPVTIVGHDFLIKRANLAAAALARRDIREVVGNHCFRVLAGRKGPCQDCPMVGSLRSSQAEESRIFRFSRQHDFHVQSYPMKGDVMVMHYRDITQETQMQQKLIQAERLATLGMLAGNVAHEINNPLGGILAFTQLAMRALPGDHPVREDLNEIQQAAERCKIIVEDLLNLSRQPKEKEKERLELNKVIGATLPLMRLRMKEGGVQLVEELDDGMPPVKGNAGQIQQVLINLLTNALHAMPQGGEVRLSTVAVQHSRAVDIIVEDHGIGIPPNNLPKIFDPFFTTKRAGEGAGLGLAISRNLIWEHGGTIDVKSEIGKGSTFRVRLPAYREKSASER